MRLMLRYPNKYVQVGKMFANPELMSEENLQSFTGKQTVNGSAVLAASFYSVEPFTVSKLSNISVGPVNLFQV